MFCRFAGCNLWTGLEADRSSAVCQFCDTDFVRPDAGKFAGAGALADAVEAAWPAGPSHRFVVLTGGEPLLQADEALFEELHSRKFTIAVETNGTQPAPPGLDWICVSPKAGAALLLRAGDELKLVFPQPGAEPSHFEDLAFTHFLLQPMDGSDAAANTQAAIAYCLTHPQWRLSVQTHKMLGLR